MGHGDVPVCKHYKKGRCRHGADGLKPFNGRSCIFLHPRKCKKFCRFGFDQNNGCNGSCNLYHPILCRNSMKYKKCLDVDCTYAHLVGTARKPAPNYVQGSLQKHHQEEFVDKQSEFPSLYNVQDDKLKESTISQFMQSCLTYLMKQTATNIPYPAPQQMQRNETNRYPTNPSIISSSAQPTIHNYQPANNPSQYPQTKFQDRNHQQGSNFYFQPNSHAQPHFIPAKNYQPHVQFSPAKNYQPPAGQPVIPSSNQYPQSYQLSPQPVAPPQFLH